MSPSQRTFPRVLVVGLDGASYDVLVPLAEAGVMPNLACLLRECSLQSLSSTDPYTTPVAWTSFLTGCDVARHGVLDYRYLDHARRELLLNHAGRVPCPTLLTEVAAAGGQVVSLSLPMTYPAPAHVPGIIVGGLDSPSGEAALAPYPEYQRRLQQAGVRYSVETIWKRRPRSFEELATGVARTIREFDDRVTAARIADVMTDWRLMIVQFQTLDSLQHRCWELLTSAPPGSPATPPSEAWVREALRAMQVLDHCLGQLIELAERRQAALCVLGDHGFGPFRQKICVNEVLRRRGLQHLASRGTALRHRAVKTAWKARKWLHRRRQGGSTAGVARPIEALAPLDWERSAAVAMHGELSALVYFNTAKRFGRGAVMTSTQRDQAEADTLAAFREATHPETAEPLFEEAFSTARRWHCDPVSRAWPDVIALPASGFHTRTKFDGLVLRERKLLYGDPTLTGTHRRDSLLLIRGASSGHGPPARMHDVAPTILRLLGQPSGRWMEGQSCLTDGEDQPHYAIASRRIADDPRPGVAPTSLTQAQQQTVTRRLRDLGYLE